MLNRILDMVDKWDKLGQFVFFFIILVICYHIIRLPVILIKGWPPPERNECEEED